MGMSFCLSFVGFFDSFSFFVPNWRGTFGIKASQIVHGNRESSLISFFKGEKCIPKKHQRCVPNKNTFLGTITYPLLFAGTFESMIFHLKTLRRLQRVLNAYAGADKADLLVETWKKRNLYRTTVFQVPK